MYVGWCPSIVQLLLHLLDQVEEGIGEHGTFGISSIVGHASVLPTRYEQEANESNQKGNNDLGEELCVHRRHLK
jgi:hypothetical protein